MKLISSDAFGLIIAFLKKNGYKKAAEYIAKKAKYVEDVIS